MTKRCDAANSTKLSPVSAFNVYTDPYYARERTYAPPAGRTFGPQPIRTHNKNQ